MHTPEEIAALLQIHRAAHEVGNLTNISNGALNRLKQINDEMGPDGFGAKLQSYTLPEALPEEPEPEAQPEAEGETTIERKL
jgi:hypothetical protein